MDQGKCVGTVFIDLSKAFNTIDHSMLLGKLRSYGINDLEHRWFTSYLDGRQQRVSVDGELSEWANVITGMPQGSILGLLLYLIYMNDLPHVVTDSTMNLYADYITIYTASMSPNAVSHSLSADLARIAKWIEVNKLRMNVNRTQLMTLGSRTSRCNAQQIDVQLKGCSIPQSDSIKYLAVTVNRELKWKSPLASIRTKAFAAIAYIRKVSPFLPVCTRKMLYQTLVLPHLDYCSVVWHSCSQALTHSIECIQNYAMRVILSKPPGTPSAPLRSRLGWFILHKRRQNFLLCQVHHYVFQPAPTT